MRVSRRFTAFCVSLSDTTRDAPTPAGIAGLRHKQRHKNDTWQWTPSGSIRADRRAPDSPAREGGLVLASSHTTRNRNDGCKLSRLRRQAVEGTPHPPAPQHRSQPLAIYSMARQRYNPFSNSESVVPRAEAILLRVRSPGSRVPRSRSEMWTSWTPECSARSICRQPLARRSFRMRAPVAAQMSFAMRP
jgi:hypothetical protein